MHEFCSVSYFLLVFCNRSLICNIFVMSLYNVDEFVNNMIHFWNLILFSIVPNSYIMIKFLFWLNSKNQNIIDNLSFPYLICYEVIISAMYQFVDNWLVEKYNLYIVLFWTFNFCKIYTSWHILTVVDLNLILYVCQGRSIKWDNWH